eukprot:6180773-Pleurochrysis_carterae.AAC.4
MSACLDSVLVHHSPWTRRDGALHPIAAQRARHGSMAWYGGSCGGSCGGAFECGGRAERIADVRQC